MPAPTPETQPSGFLTPARRKLLRPQIIFFPAIAAAPIFGFLVLVLCGLRFVESHLHPEMPFGSVIPTALFCTGSAVVIMTLNWVAMFFFNLRPRTRRRRA